MSSEIASNCALNANAMKKISNGGSDMLVCRNHNGNDTPFTPHFLPVIFAKDLLKIAPCDDAIDNRLRVISYVKQYVDEFELQKDDNVRHELAPLGFH
jgi:hypothetical protein